VLDLADWGFETGDWVQESRSRVRSACWGLESWGWAGPLGGGLSLREGWWIGGLRVRERERVKEGEKRVDRGGGEGC